MNDRHIEAEADAAVSILSLWLKILVYLIAFAAMGAVGFLTFRWVFFS